MAINQDTILSVHDDELTLLEAINEIKQKYEEVKPLYWHKLEISASNTTGNVTTPIYLSVLSRVETYFTKAELIAEYRKVYPLICADDDDKMHKIYLINENNIQMTSIGEQPTNSVLTNWSIDDDTRTLL